MTKLKGTRNLSRGHRCPRCCKLCIFSQTKPKMTYFDEQKAIILEGIVHYRPLSNLKNTMWYLTTRPKFIKFGSKLFDKRADINGVMYVCIDRLRHKGNIKYIVMAGA